MSNSAIDTIMATTYGVDFVASTEAEDHPETGGSIRIYEGRRLGIRMLVEIDPNGRAVVYTFYKNLN